MKHLAAFLLFLVATPLSAFECHTALVLALDASRSVDRREHELQRRGLAEALRAPEVMAALAPHRSYGSIAMAFEWSNPGSETVLAPWAVLNDQHAIHQFADQVQQGPQIARRHKTGLGAAMRFAAEARSGAPADCARYVIDISGDGPGNAGTSPASYREAGLLDGVVINGLVIRHPNLDSAQPPLKDPLPYYQLHVIQGPGAFVEVVDSYDDYPAAIRRKLLRELSPSLAAVR